MPARTIAKIVFLVIISICAVIAVFSGVIVGRKNKDSKMDKFTARFIMRIRLGCFLVMLICLFICLVI